MGARAHSWGNSRIVGHTEIAEPSDPELVLCTAIVLQRDFSYLM